RRTVRFDQRCQPARTRLRVIVKEGGYGLRRRSKSGIASVGQSLVSLVLKDCHVSELTAGSFGQLGIVVNHQQYLRRRRMLCEHRLNCSACLLPSAITVRADDNAHSEMALPVHHLGCCGRPPLRFRRTHPFLSWIRRVDSQLKPTDNAGRAVRIWRRTDDHVKTPARPAQHLPMSPGAEGRPLILPYPRISTGQNLRQVLELVSA